MVADEAQGLCLRRSCGPHFGRAGEPLPEGDGVIIVGERRADRQYRPRVRSTDLELLTSAGEAGVRRSCGVLTPGTWSAAPLRPRPKRGRGRLVRPAWGHTPPPCPPLPGGLRGRTGATCTRRPWRPAWWATGTVAGPLGPPVELGVSDGAGQPGTVTVGVRIPPPQTPSIQPTTLERAAVFKGKAAWVPPCR